MQYMKKNLIYLTKNTNKYSYIKKKDNKKSINI